MLPAFILSQDQTLHNRKKFEPVIVYSTGSTISIELDLKFFVASSPSRGDARTSYCTVQFPKSFFRSPSILGVRITLHRPISIASRESHFLDYFFRIF